MPYTTPNTVSGSDTLTAALWNTQIRDNFEIVGRAPSCIMYLTAAQTMASGNNLMASSSFQTNTASMSATANRIIAPVAGYYQVSYSLSRSNYTIATVNPTTASFVAINGTSISWGGAGSYLSQAASFSPGVAGATHNVSHANSGLMYLAANDYIQVYLNYNGAGTAPQFCVTRDALSMTLVASA